jgi:ketosteroid isomerase-like protein
MTGSMTESRDAQTPPCVDAEAFITAAERATNAYDLEAILAVYADHALLEVITDGALETHRGKAELYAAWFIYLDVMRRGSFQLRKQLVVADGSTITNRWQGTLDGNPCRGVETWQFNDGGLVREHRMYSYLNVEPASGLSMRIRLLIAYPRTAMRFLRAQHARVKGDDRRT